MGSFNETCLISSLPIRSGQEVTMLLIQPKPKAFEEGMYCYINAYADVAPLPFYGKYNDYGSVEDYHGPAMDLLVEEVRKVVEEKEWGDNKCHDVPVDRNDFDMEKLLEAAWEGRLAVKYYGSANLLQYVFVLQSVMDKIINEFQVEDCYFEKVGKGRAERNIYHRYSYGFKSIVRDIPEYIARLRATITEMNSAEAEESRLRFIFRREILGDLFAWNHPNLAAKFLSFRTQEGEREVIFNTSNFIIAQAEKMTDEQLTELLTEFLKVQWLRCFMNRANKMIIKPMTSGQEGDTSAHQLIASATAEYIAERKEEDKQWNDDEDEDNPNYPKLVKMDDEPEYALRLRTAATADN